MPRRPTVFSRVASLVVGLLTFWVVVGTAPADADTWLLDKQNTSVRFTWDHLGLSRQSAQFLDLDGRLEFSPTDPEGGTVDIAIKTASVSSGVREYDNNLKSADFFNVANNPIITFKSTAVRRLTDKTGEVDGELTMLGVSKPVTLKVVWNYTGEHPLATVNPTYKHRWVSGFSATTTVLRSAWGLTRALPLVSDEIRITIEAEFLLKDLGGPSVSDGTAQPATGQN
jgi:polyisoprenoid-binding protein YceI